MTLYLCIDCGIPATGTRCTTCYRTRQRNRNATRGDRYGAAHRANRRRWVNTIAHYTVPCARCHGDIEAGTDWHLDHLEDGSTWPSHAWCNSGARRDA